MGKRKFPNQTVERLTALRGILNMHERAQAKGEPCKLNGESRNFNMQTWDCGSAACALGSAALNPWFKERGLKLKKVHDLSGAMVPVYQGARMEECGAKFFGITVAESLDLFFSQYYPREGRNFKGEVTPAMVRNRVEALIEKYSK